MFVPVRGDLLIRTVSSQGKLASFLIAEAQTDRTLAGPFDTLRDATLAASKLADGRTIWQETLDYRGRRLGEPMRVPVKTERLQRPA
jgi:hypothetical protein